MRFINDNQRKAVFANMANGPVSGINRVKFSASSSSSVVCPKCGSKIWDTSNVDQRLNKCWKCGLRFDNMDNGPVISGDDRANYVEEDELFSAKSDIYDIIRESGIKPNKYAKSYIDGLGFEGQRLDQ